MAQNTFIEKKVRSNSTTTDKRDADSSNSAARRKLSESFAFSFSIFKKKEDKNKKENDKEKVNRTRKISCPINIPTFSNRQLQESSVLDKSSPPNERPRSRRFSLQAHPQPYMRIDHVAPSLPSTINEDTAKISSLEISTKPDSFKDNSKEEILLGESHSLFEEQPVEIMEIKKGIGEKTKSRFSETLKVSPYGSTISSGSISPSIRKADLPNNLSSSDKKKSIINMFEGLISAEEKSRKKLNHFYEKKKSVGIVSSTSSSPKIQTPIRSASMSGRQTRRTGAYALPPTEDVIAKWKKDIKKSNEETQKIDSKIELQKLSGQENQSLNNKEQVEKTQMKITPIKEREHKKVCKTSTLPLPEKRTTHTSPGPNRRRSTITPEKRLNYPVNFIPPIKTGEMQSTEKTLTLTRMKLEQLIQDQKDDEPTIPFERTNALDNASDSNDSGSVSSKAFSKPESPKEQKISVIENPFRKENLDKLPDSSRTFKDQFIRGYLYGERLDGDSGIDDEFMNFNFGKGERVLSLKDIPPSHIISKRVPSELSSVADDTEQNPVEEESLEEPVVVLRQKRGRSGRVAGSIVSLDEIPKSRRMSRVEGFQDMMLDFGSYENGSFESNYMGESLSKRVSMYSPLVTFDTTDGTEIVADSETRDIISDSHDTISQCSTKSRPTSMYFPPSGWDKMIIEEEPADFVTTKKVDETSQPHSSSGSSCSNSTINDEDVRNHRQPSRNVSHKNSDTSVTPKVSKSGLEWPKINGHVSPVESFNQEKPASNQEKGKLLRKQETIEESRSTTFSTMFGYFNYSLYNFISKEYGLEKWKEIVSSLNLNKKQIAMFERPKHSMVDDEVTDLVLRTASKVCRSHFNLFMQRFGSSYFEFCCSKYGDILKSIATNLADFINNMDDIRRHIHKIEKIADHNPPSIFAVVDRQHNLSLYYYSKTDQRCLEYFLVGFIKSASWILYGLKSRVSLQQQRKDNNDYSIITIKAVNSLVKKASVSKLHVSTKCKDLIVEPTMMDEIFPFHIILDNNLNFCQLGSSLNRLLEHFFPTHGINLKTYFEVEKPIIDITYSSIKNNLNTAFIFVCKQEIVERTFCARLTLKGQMVFLESSNCLWFIASPKVETVSQLNMENNLFLSDIPIHDATRQVLLVNERTNAQDILKNQLQVLTNRLKETSKELALGKVNTENVLDEIFPKDVAERLMRGLPVPAVTAEEVSILFTDIVGFTSICGSCDPEDVTHMLNNLYLQFDLLCEKYEVYKVETIGDAYMAVGGLHHRKEKDHGRTTTLMGLNMVQSSSKVQTPMGDNIQIRVGIHSGSVVAGVVGTVMPRYCLFGNNVTLANKMESTSANGKVHISPATYVAIKHYEEFIFWERPRDVLPKLMSKLYRGNSYFVSQRRPSTYEKPIAQQNEKRLPYMMPARQIIEEIPRKAPSRKTSYTESVISDNTKYPENLREELKNLEKLTGYQNGKTFRLPRI